MTARVDAAVTAMRGAVAPPRRNGELVFEAPWQGRAFGMAVHVVDRLGLEWKVFQERLIAAIAAEPARPYYESWVAALEALLLDRGIVRPDELEKLHHGGTETRRTRTRKRPSARSAG